MDRRQHAGEGQTRGSGGVVNNEEKILAILEEMRANQLRSMEIQRRAVRRAKITVPIIILILVIGISLMVWGTISAH